MEFHRQLFAELKRRHVFKVAAVYGAVGFGVLQLADILVPALELPNSVTKATALVLVLGFPVALVLAWAFDLTRQGVQRTGPADAAEVRRIASEPRAARWRIGVAAALGSALLAGGAFWALTGSETDSPGGNRAAGGALDEHVIAVLPFGVQGGPDVQYLGAGMVGLLSTKLDGAGDLRAVDSRSVLRLAEREGYPAHESVAAGIADFFGAGLLVTGDIVEAGGRMQISAAVGRVGEDEIASASVEGASDDVFALVDRLTSQLLSGMRGGPAARVQRIAAVTTASVPALKAFYEGEEHFRAGRFANAIASFRRATEEDSMFALAFYRLSMASEWGVRGTSHEPSARALRLSGELSDRDRRIIEAYRTRWLGRNREAERLYRSILGNYPDEIEAWLDLSEIQFHGNPLRGISFTQAKPSLTRVLEFDPHHAAALRHYARIAAYEGDAVAVDSLTGRLLESLGDVDVPLNHIALRAAAVGDSAALRSLIERLPAASEEQASGVSNWASLFSRRYDIARAASRSLTQTDRSAEARRMGYAELAHWAAAEERWDEVKVALDSLAEMSPGVGTIYRGMIATLPIAPTDSREMRDIKDALERLDAEDVETSRNPGLQYAVHDSAYEIIRRYLLGLLSASLGEPSAANAYADSLEATESWPEIGSLPQDLAYGVRAEVLRRQDRLEEALAMIERQARYAHYSPAYHSGVFSRARERFLQAELLHALGRDEEARRYYETIDQVSRFDVPYRPAAARRLSEIGAGPPR